MKHKKDKNELSLAEHFKELKHRFIFTAVVFLMIFIVSYANCNILIENCIKLGKEIGYEFIYFSPQEVLIQQIRIAAITSLILSLPVVVYEIIVFIAPIFSSKKSFIGVIIFGIVALILFMLGALFAYKIMIPFVYKFLFDIGNTLSIVAQVSIKEYISLFITFEICLGTITELPLICVMLTKIGILTPAIMVKIRSYMIVAIMILSAVITPPDVVSQAMVALPMIGLYQLSIFICKFVKRRKQV